jgi:hypothetical protein
MNTMFFHQPFFNQNIGGWDVSKVTNFNSFLNTGYNSTYGLFNNGGSNSIKNWNTSAATIMSSMFSQQPNFNQEVGLWDVSKLTNFNHSRLYLWVEFNYPSKLSLNV